METSQTIGKLSTALAKAQGEIRGATKDSTNPHFRSKYADLASVRDAIQEALSKNGIAYVQFPEGGPETVTITTVLTCGEEWMRASYSMRPVKADPQGMGSAITYARRYALMAAVGVAPEDDDGNAASNPKNGQGFSPVKNEANRIAEEIEACGEREQLDAYMATAEVQTFLKRAEDEAKRFPSGIHLGDLTMQRYHDRHAKLPERRAEQKMFTGASAVERLTEETARILDRIDVAESDAELKEISAEVKAMAIPDTEKPIINKAYKQRKQTIAQKEAA